MEDDAYDATVGLIRENIGYEALCTMEYDIAQVDELVSIMADLMSSNKKSMMVGGERIPLWKLKKRIQEIDMILMQYILECLSNNISKVRNVRKYLIATLYNAPTTMNTYYQQAVNYDMASFDSKKERGGQHNEN